MDTGRYTGGEGNGSPLQYSCLENPMEGGAILLIYHTSKVVLKILHARLQHYANQELPDVQARFSKGRGTRDQIANIC